MMRYPLCLLLVVGSATALAQPKAPKKPLPPDEVFKAINGHLKSLGDDKRFVQRYEEAPGRLKELNDLSKRLQDAMARQKTKPPPDYLMSLTSNAYLLELCVDDLKKWDGKDKEVPLKALSRLKDVASDLKIKVDFLERRPPRQPATGRTDGWLGEPSWRLAAYTPAEDSSPKAWMVRVVVHTKSGTEEVSGYEVKYILKGLDGVLDRDYHTNRFDRLSSPTEKLISPGRYYFWPLKEGQSCGEKVVVSPGDDGKGDKDIDLPIKP
jgi:hypothetical protein